MKFLKYLLNIVIVTAALLTVLFSCEKDNDKPPFVEQPLPSVSTGEVTDIAGDAATFWGSISSDGGYTIIESGFCINISANPTINNAIMIAYGVGTNQSFTIRTGDFELNTTYYVCAFAKSKVGIAYGNQISFTTTNGLPVITSIPISNITGTSAQSGGNIISNGGYSVTQKGVCWGTSQNPTIESNLGYTIEGGTEYGVFTSNITGLVEWENYYLRAYATNEKGTSYGDQIIFNTGTITDYDGNIYETIKIGSQIWMKDNLKTTHYADGTEIELVQNYASWNALELSDKAMCYFTNTSGVVISYNYGGLYNWAAAMNGSLSSNNIPSGVQGACPDGWHLPSENEWVDLIDFLGGQSIAGGKLKESGIAYWYSPNTGATNESGFTALPSSFRSYDGGFGIEGNYATYTSSTEYNSTTSSYIMLTYDNENVGRNISYKKQAYSIRCIRD